MIKLYMLDTNTVSYIVKGTSPAARSKLASLGRDEIASVSAITEAELLYGLAKIGAGEQRRQAVSWLLSRLRVEPWDRSAAAVYGPLRAKQEAAGKSLSSLDMQIAAHAIAKGATLVSKDRIFRLVPDLPACEDWAPDL